MRQKIVNYRFSDMVGEVVVVIGLLFILGGIYLWSVTGEEHLREGAFIIALGLMLALAGVGISAQRERRNYEVYDVHTD